MHAIDDTTMVSRLIRRGPVTVTPDATLRTVCEILLREEGWIAGIGHASLARQAV